MRRILKYSLVAFAILSSTTLFAQKKWSLEECINYALQNNIQLKRSFYASDMIKSDYTKSYAEIAPTIYAYGNHGISKGLAYNYYQNKYEDRKVESGSFGITSELDIFQGFYKVNSISSNKYAYLASKSDIEKFKNDLTLNIVAGYLQVLYSSEMADLANEQLSVAELKMEKAKSQFDLGQLSEGSYIDIKAQYTLEKKNQTVASNNLNLNKLSLAQFLEVDSVEKFQIQTDNTIAFTTSEIPKTQDIYSYASEQLPEIKSSKYRLKQSEKTLNMAHSMLSPRLFLSFDYNTRYSQNASDPYSSTLRPYPDYSYSNQISDNRYVSLRLNIQIPIFNKFSTQNAISKARINVIDKKAALDETQKQVLKSIQQAYADAMAAKETYVQSFDAVNSLQLVFDYSSQKFDLGMINAVDYGIARTNLIKAKGELIYAKYSYILKLKILDFYRGIPISL